MENGLPEAAVAELTAVSLTNRDQRNRDIIFNVEVDKVWNQIQPLVGAEMGAEMRVVLRNQGVEEA